MQCNTAKLYNNIYHFLESRSKVFHAVLSVLLDIGIGYLDYVTSDFDFVLIYIFPIFISTWFISKGAGITVSVLSCITSFCVNFESTMAKNNYQSMALHFGLDMSFFIFLGFMFWMLRQKYDEVNNLALRDPLTQSLNRRSLTELVEFELVISRRYRRPFSVAFLDLDNFKVVNDRFGHNVGDILLRRVVHVITSTVRITDLVARIGGDEFVVALPETNAEQSMKVLNRIRDALLEAMDTEGWPVTFSIGAVTCNWPDCSWDEICNRADMLMYQVKSGTKNGILHEVIDKQLSPSLQDTATAEFYIATTPIVASNGILPRSAVTAVLFEERDDPQA